MKLLLDTNALIWWFQDSPKLGIKARSLIEDANSTVIVSIVSLWEITIKWRIGKLEFSGTSLLGLLEDLGIALVSVEPVHLIALDAMPIHHRDPYDHLILAQAKVEGAHIVTSDTDMPGYGVPCIPALR
jgi:PIN domain nuclease of toxin-antitoxin system